MWVETSSGDWVNLSKARKLEVNDRRRFNLPSQIVIPVTTEDDSWEETIAEGENVDALRQLAGTLVSWHCSGRNITEYKDVQRLYKGYAGE